MTTPRCAKRLAPVLLLLVVSTAACGSDDSGALSKADYQKQADAVCAAAGEKMNPIFEAIFPKLETATEAERKDAVDQMSKVIHQEIDDLAALEPPSDMADDVDAMLASVRTAADTMADQGADFWLNDSDPFADANQKAAALGLKACADDGSE